MSLDVRESESVEGPMLCERCVGWEEGGEIRSIIVSRRLAYCYKGQRVCFTRKM